MQFIFADWNAEFANEIANETKNAHFKSKSKLKPLISTFTGDVRKVPNLQKIQKGGGAVAYVSPANSVGWMDGGIDEVYSKMFPNIQTQVQDAIKKYNNKNTRGYYQLPVGSALLIEPQPRQFLICAPTMWKPEIIVDQPDQFNNAYWAFRAVLALTDKYNKRNKPPLTTIVCPGLCTGCGQIPFDESARQIIKAFNDHDAIHYADDKPDDCSVIWNSATPNTFS